MTGIDSQDGKSILKTDNMFLSHRVPIKSLLTSTTTTTSSTHTLVLTFTSAWLQAKKIELEQLALAKAAKEAGKPMEGRGDGSSLKFWNGNSSRLYVRKAQYGFGWDWVS
jgi:beta-mannosidase